MRFVFLKSEKACNYDMIICTHQFLLYRVCIMMQNSCSLAVCCNSQGATGRKWDDREKGSSMSFMPCDVVPRLRSADNHSRYM